MNITCEKCGADINVPNKKNQMRKSCNKTHRIVMCKSCGCTNYVPVLFRYAGENTNDF
jgi:hypothetical protein